MKNLWSLLFIVFTTAHAMERKITPPEDIATPVPTVQKGDIFKITRNGNVSCQRTWSIKEPLDSKISPYALSERILELSGKRNKKQPEDGENSDQHFYFKAETEGKAQLVLQLTQAGKLLKEETFAINIIAAQSSAQCINNKLPQE